MVASMTKENMALYDPWSGDAVFLVPSNIEGYTDIVSAIVGTIITVETDRTANAIADVLEVFHDSGFLEPDCDLIYVAPDRRYVH